MAVITAAADDWTSRLALDNGNNQDIDVDFTQIPGGTGSGSRSNSASIGTRPP